MLRKILKMIIPYGMLVYWRKFISRDKILKKYRLVKDTNDLHLCKTNISAFPNLHLNNPQTKQSGENFLQITHEEYKAPFFIRNGTSDVLVYRDLIQKKDYNFTVEKEPESIVDAGANIGLASLFFANKYPNATIIAIEPDESNIELLEMNIKPYKNIHLLKGALWDSSGEIDLFDAGLGNWGFMVGSKDNHSDIKLPFKSTNKTKAYTVDEIMKLFNWNSIDILKMDIEGSEKEVLSNSSKWIDKVSLLIVELHDRMKEGCEDAFYKIVNRFDNFCVNGEDIYLIKNNFIKTEKI